MPEAKPMELLKSIKELYTASKDPAQKGDVLAKLSKVYLIYGDNGFIRERAVQRLKGIITTLGGGVERAVFEKTADFNGWISSLYDMPMFSSIRIIIAGEVSALKDDEVKSLIEYCKNPSQEVTLVLLSEKINTKKNIIKELIANTTSCKDEIKEDGKKDNLGPMIRGFAAERGKAIDNEAVEFLKIKFGAELLTIEKEIEKVSVYIGKAETIKGRDVEFLSTGVSNCSIFDLPPLFASRNKKKLFEVIHKLLEAGEPPILINNIVSSRIQKLLMAHDLIKAGATDGEIASNTSTPPFFVRDLKTELKNYKRDELANMYKRCMYIDSELKSAKREHADVLISGALKLIERT